MKNILSITAVFAAGALLCGGLVAGILAPSALAQSKADAEPFRFHFQYAPTELTSAKDASRLLSRLEHDVRRHCGDYGRMPLDQKAAVKTCINATMREATDTFGSAVVADAYHARTEG